MLAQQGGFAIVVQESEYFAACQEYLVAAGVVGIHKNITGEEYNIKHFTPVGTPAPLFLYGDDGFQSEFTSTLRVNYPP